MVVFPKVEEHSIQVRARPRFAFETHLWWPLFATCLCLELYAWRISDVDFGRAVSHCLLILNVICIFIIGLARHRLTQGFVYAFSFIALIIICGYAGRYPAGILQTVLVSFIEAKILLMMIAVAKLSFSDLRPMISVVSSILLIGGACSSIAPDHFVGLIPSVGFDREVSQVVGFTLNDNRTAALALLPFGYFLVGKRFFTAAIFFAIVTLTGSVSMFVIAVLLACGVINPSLTRFAKSFLVLSAFLILGVLLATQNVQNKLDAAFLTVDGEGAYTRAGLLLGGWQISTENFPFGAGAGSFGSSFSDSSPAYADVGLDEYRAIEDMSGVYDSGIASILGQVGFAGLGVTVLGIWLLMGGYGNSSLTFQNKCLLVFMFLFMSFFRTVSSDVFYAFVISIIAIFLRRDVPAAQRSYNSV